MNALKEISKEDAVAAAALALFTYIFLWAVAPIATNSTTVLSVTTYGAVGNGVTDDGKAFQDAIDAAGNSSGGGAVSIPAGTYFIDRTLVIPDNVEIYGVSEASTILKRGNTASTVTTYADTTCTTTSSITGRILFINSKYNCGNTGIKLHDFTIDGGQVITVPTAVTIAFSAVKNTTIADLTLEDVPQDGIFIKNGGVNVSVTSVIINGFNMRWGNGGGINFEYRSEANYAGCPLVADNIINVGGPNFCEADLKTECASDATCAAQGFNASSCTGVQTPWFCCTGAGTGSGCTSTCGTGNATVAGISVTWIDTAQQPPRPSLVRNTIKVTDKHYGIICTGCQDADITNNTITATTSSTSWSQLFTGISMDSVLARPIRDVVIERNTITGAGVSGDGRGILVSNSSSASYQASVKNNTVTNKALTSGLAGIEIRGFDGVFALNNTITDISNGHGLVIGSCSLITKNGQVSDNTISVSGSGIRPIVLRAVNNISVLNNTLTPASPGVETQC